MHLLPAKVDAVTQRLHRMDVNAVNSSASLHCEIYSSIEHLALNCQVGSPFAQDTTEVNYVNNSNTYNSGLRNHPKVSYRPNHSPLSMPQMNARPPLKSQRPPFS